MTHDVTLIAMLAAGFGLSLLLGLVALRLRLPALVGYLMAGVAIGPFTPGYVADSGLAGQLAEIGVMLLMFGVGLHFSLDEALAVRRTRFWPLPFRGQHGGTAQCTPGLAGDGHSG